MRICVGTRFSWKRKIAQICATLGRERGLRDMIDSFALAISQWEVMEMLICICDNLKPVNVTGLRRHHISAGSKAIMFGCFLEWIYVGY